MRQQFRFTSIAALAATVSLIAAPVSAADNAADNFGLAGAPAGSAINVRAEPLQGWGWGGGYGRGWGGGRHHDRGVDVGDVIAGVLVIGAIAAIADAAHDDSDNRRRRDERDNRDYRQQETRPAQMRGNYQSSRGIDSAVSMCVDQIERGADRVESVDNAARTSDGWRVSGALQDGSGWNCWIDNDGRLRAVDLSGAQADEQYRSAAVSSAAPDRQLSDEAYARARAAQVAGGTMPAVVPASNVAAASASASEPRPAYPGGPLPGEEGYGEAAQSNAT